MSTTLTYGPNDHHLVKDDASGRFVPQPGLGDVDDAIARARRPITAGELALSAARAVTAEDALAGAQSEIERLKAELAKATKKSAA